jgi:hypothetical protein
MAHPQNALAGLADHGKSLGEEVVQRFAPGESLAEFCRFPGEGLVGKGSDGRFEGIDPVDHRLHPFELALVLASDDFSYQ